MLTMERIKQRANDFAEFLVTNHNLRRKGNVVSGRCPKPDHPDKHPSFSYYPESDGYACSCSKGKGSELRAALGYSHPVDNMWEPSVNHHRSVKAKTSPRKQPANPVSSASDSQKCPSNASGKEGESSKTQEVPIIIPEEKSPLEQLADMVKGESSEKLPIRHGREPDCVHNYSNGHQKLKWRIPGQKNDYVWRYRSNGQWIYEKNGDPGLYNEHRIPESDLIILSESESDCDALAELGYVAVSNPAGASETISEEWAKKLSGKEVVIMQHNDENGIKYANRSKDIISDHAKKCWIVEILGSNDIREAINNGADRKYIDLMILDAKPKPPIGIPFSDLVNITDDNIDYIVEPLIPRGALCQLQGEPKGGKSCFALYVALCAAQGIWTAGQFSIKEKSKVLFITWEDGAIRLKRRGNQYNPPLKFGPIPDNLIMYPHDIAPQLWVNHPDGEKFLLEIIQYHQADLVILDTLSYLHDADENRSHEMKPVMQALKSCATAANCSIMLVHHTRKASTGGDLGSVQARGRGSSAIAAAADTIIDWGKRAGENITNCQFLSKDDDSFDFSVHYKLLEDGLVEWKIGEKAEKMRSVQTKETVLEAVKQLYGTDGHRNGVNRSAILEIVNLSKNSVIKYLRKLEEDGEIIGKTNGKNHKIKYVPTGPLESNKQEA